MNETLGVGLAQAAAAQPVVNRFAGAVALVTGAGRGIGRAISIALAESGATVALCARSEDQLDLVGAEISTAGGAASVYPSDITEEGVGERLVKRIEKEVGPIRILVNAAGISPTYSSAERIAVEDYDLIMATNVRAPFLLSQAVGARMLEREAGTITNISSIGGTVALPRLAAYCAAKSALNSLTRVMAVEWADRNVRVNAVAPGYVTTDMAKNLIDHPEIGPSLLARSAMHRFGTPEEIARVVVFLASDDASYITGQTISVDGGWTAQ